MEGKIIITLQNLVNIIHCQINLIISNSNNNRIYYYFNTNNRVIKKRIINSKFKVVLN